MNQTISHSDRPTTPDTSLLIYMTLMVLLITLIPFRFYVPEKISILWKFHFADIITNILLFIPIGFLFGHWQEKKERFFWKAICFGIGLSLLIETLQAFMTIRATSGIDVLANGSGAFLGAWFFYYAKNKIREQDAFRVSSLQIPLVNLVLLLTPLLWITCISSGNEPIRLYLLIPLGVFGSGLLSSVYVNRMVFNGISPDRFVLTAVCWFVLSTLPAMARFPKDMAIIWVVVILIIAFQALSQKQIPSKERRFEMATLKKFFPIYGLYLLILLVLPTAMGMGKFPQQVKLMTTIRLVEAIAAFTVMGFVMAEMRGRKDASPLKGLTLGVIVAALLIIITHLIKGSDPFTWKKIYLNLPLIAATLYGGILYRIQLAAFRRA